MVNDTEGKKCACCYSRSFEVEDDELFCTECGSFIESEEDLLDIDEED